MTDETDRKMNTRTIDRRGFIAGTFAAALAAGCRTAATRPALRVLTYNLHHSEGLDGKVDLERIARIIRGSGADLVALQELDRRARRTGSVDQPAEYIRLTGLHGEFGAAMDLQGGEYGQMLLSRWPLSGFATHHLPNPSKREPRIAVSAMVRPPGMPGIRFVGAHLDATRDDGDRRLQSAELHRLFTDATPTILAGDLNDLPGSPVVRGFSEGWSDTAAGDPQPTNPADAPKVRIDYVFARPAERWRVVSIRVLDERVASDHRPVLAELEWDAA